MVHAASHAFIVTAVALYISANLKVGHPHARKALKDVWASCVQPLTSWRGDSELRQRIHEQWMGPYRSWVSLLLISLECYGTVFAVLGLVRTEGSKPAYRDTHLWAILLGLMALRGVIRGPSGCGGPWGPRIVVIMTHVGGAMTRLDIPKALVPMVVLGDVMVSLLSADPVFSIWTRVLCSPLYVMADWTCETAAAGWEHLFLIMINEMFTCFFTSVILLQGDYLFCKKELATMSLEKQVQQREDDMKELEQFICAAKRLLSVVCDCCEQLSHDWEILQPSQKVMQLLRVNVSPTPGSLPFLNHVCQEDRERFLEFVKASGSSEAPSSLHLKMTTCNNFILNTQLFHVPLPSRFSQQLQHLIGITIHAQEPRLETQSIPEHDLLDVGVGGLRQLAGRPSQVPPRPRRRRTSQSDSSSSSGSSPSPNQSANGWMLVPFLRDSLQEVQSVHLLVDLMTGSSGYAIRGATVSYKMTAAVAKLPRLYDWVKPKHQPRVEDWMQEHLNAWYHREHLDERCLGVKFQIPGLGATFVAGELCMRGIVDGAVGPAEVGQSEQDYNLLMQMELRTLIPEC